jgi:hypothetical protein
MSRKNFLNEINKMTRKGVYPSLNILLEEKDEDAMGGDNPFGDSDSEETESEETSEESEGEETSEESESEGEGEGGEGEGGEEDVNADTIKMDQLLKQFKETTAALDARRIPTKIESDLNIESFRLSDYTLINESEDDPQKLFDKLSKTIEKNKDTSDQFGNFSAEKINGVDLNVDDLVLQAAADVESFFSKEDPASIICARYLKKIRKLGEIPDIEKVQEEFVSKLQQKLDKSNIDNTLPSKYSVNSIENTGYNNAGGAKSSA